MQAGQVHAQAVAQRVNEKGKRESGRVGSPNAIIDKSEQRVKVLIEHGENCLIDGNYMMRKMSETGPHCLERILTTPSRCVIAVHSGIRSSATAAVFFQC